MSLPMDTTEIPGIRIWRSPDSRFGEGSKTTPDGDLEDETITAERAYTDEELARIAREGFNGIWLHAVLRHLVSVEPFTQLGRNARQHQQALARLIERAAGHGISVWLYMQPPRAVPTSWADFWQRHPEAAGQEEEVELHPSEGPVRYRCLCTSTPVVKKWLADAAAELARRLPGLAGVILITSSEFPAHCHTRRTSFDAKPWRPRIQCPRCGKRDPEEVAAEVVSLVSEGLARFCRKARVVVWNWSWGWREDSQERMIARLPREAMLMADFERGGVRDVPGRKAFLFDEYSLSYPGPSERFLRCARAAAKHGLPLMAKLQLGTTHELATVVNLPMIGSLYQKARHLTETGMAGFMGCWNFGNYPSANTAAFRFFLRHGEAKESALEAFAADYFPGCSPELVRRAWELFETAMLYYPFTIAFLYHGPQNHTLAYTAIFRPGPLDGRPAGRSWQPDERGDDLSNSYQLHHTQYDLDEIIHRLEHLCGLWKSGLELFRAALNGTRADEARKELGNAEICGAIWESTLHTYQIYRLRRNWAPAALEAYFRIARQEVALLERVLPSVSADPRQGIHLEPRVRMFGTSSITAKLDALREQLCRAADHPGSEREESKPSK